MPCWSRLFSGDFADDHGATDNRHYFAATRGHVRLSFCFHLGASRPLDQLRCHGCGFLRLSSGERNGRKFRRSGDMPVLNARTSTDVLWTACHTLIESLFSKSRPFASFQVGSNRVSSWPRITQWPSRPSADLANRWLSVRTIY